MESALGTMLPVTLTGMIQGRATASVWDFGDGVTVTNQPSTSHAWAALGDYTVVLRAYNEVRDSAALLQSYPKRVKSYLGQFLVPKGVFRKFW